MGALETLNGLAAFERRAAGSDSERRAALWLRDDLETRGREATVETFWCRPNWALAHAWHVAAGLAGSLVTVASPRIGGVLLLVALLSLASDALLGVSVGRRLTPERASQNVVSPAPPSAAGGRIRLLITANYDAGRTGVAYRDTPRRFSAWLRRLAHGLAPGWLGWIAIALIWLEVAALMRLGGAKGSGVGLVQLLPTVGLVLALAALLDIASAEITPGAGDNGSGVAVAVALARALDAAAPRHVAVDLLLQGASDVSGAGLRRHLSTRRKTLGRTDAIVLGIAPCGAGRVRWWQSDGSLVPLRYFRRLRVLATQLAEREPELRLGPHHGRGSTPGLPARIRRLPALTIGTLDARGVVPRSHQRVDTATNVDPGSLDLAVEAGLLLVEAIDASLASGAGSGQGGRAIAGATT